MRPWAPDPGPTWPVRGRDSDRRQAGVFRVGLAKVDNTREPADSGPRDGPVRADRARGRRGSGDGPRGGRPSTRWRPATHLGSEDTVGDEGSSSAEGSRRQQRPGRAGPAGAIRSLRAIPVQGERPRRAPGITTVMIPRDARPVPGPVVAGVRAPPEVVREWRTGERRVESGCSNWSCKSDSFPFGLFNPFSGIDPFTASRPGGRRTEPDRPETFAQAGERAPRWRRGKVCPAPRPT
jgi:hypothetical protein